MPPARRTPAAPRRRGGLFGPSRTVLCLSACLAATAGQARAHITDPEAPIATNRYRGIGAPPGGPGADASSSAPHIGAPARDDLDRGTARPPAFRTTGIAPGAPGLPLAEAAETHAVAASALVPAQSAAGQPRVYTPLETALTLNGRFLGVIGADIDLSGDGLVDTARLLALLEPVLDPALMERLRTVAAGREKTPLADLTVEGFRIGFDTGALEMRAEAGAAALAPSTLHLSGVRAAPDPAAYPDPAPFTAGLNLALQQRYRHEGEAWAPLRGAVDALIHFGGFTGLTLVAGADYDEGDQRGPWRRREARLIKDFYERAIRATAGEFTPAINSFQGSGRILGLGVERSYSTIRPFQNIRPAGREEFTLERETTVNVVVNGVPGQTLTLQPGRYSLRDFPFASGANVVQLIADDPTGRRELAVFDVFSGSDLLGDGVVEFGAAAGRYEERSPFEYDGPWVVTGFARRGLSDRLTVGLNGQASDRAGQVGGTAIWGSRRGLLLAEAAASWSELDASGWAGSLSYRQEFSVRGNDDVRVTGSVLYTSQSFTDAFRPQAFNPTALRADALVQWLGPFDTGLSLGGSWSTGRLGNPDQSQVDFAVSRSLGRISASLSLSLIDRRPGESETRVGFNLSAPLGGRWASGARYDSQDNRFETYVSRFADGGIDDVSGELRLINDDRNRDITGRLNYVNNRFEAEVSHNRLYDLNSGADRAETSLTAASFIGYAGGRIGLGRPVEEAFIIAPVHRSLRDARVELKEGSSTVARSGWFGPPVAPVRRAYGVNSFTIEVDPLPTGYDLGSGVLGVFPPYGAGYNLPVGSEASRIAIGILAGPEGFLSLATGLIEPVDARDAREPRPFFTNRQGRFVADRLVPGRYRILIGDRPVAEFTVPEDSEGVVNVGVLQTSGS